MKRIFLSFCMSLTSLLAFGTDIYDVTLSLTVPRIYDNSESQGYRKNQKQTIKGLMSVFYDEHDNVKIQFSTMTNKSYKINGKCVTYKVNLDDTIPTRWNYIGNNRTQKFATPSFVFYLNADPSYAIWDVPDEDNSMYILISGSGNSVKTRGYQKPGSLKGYVTGQIGCGCADYGHISPTRYIGEAGPVLNSVSDVAAVYGTFKAKLNKRLSNY